LGYSGAVAPENLPGNPLVVDYAPQLALLRHATLAVTHGGLNTTLESLSEGLPLVLIPIANDQPGIAARAAYLGVGEFIPLQRLAVPILRDVIQRVLAAPNYRKAATKCAAQMKNLNGPALAADLIETAFRTRRRVTRAQKAALPALERGHA
jgi:UDP:flavonoid glycosyltransferase YjiC (YdhE family)